MQVRNQNNIIDNMMAEDKFGSLQPRSANERTRLSLRPFETHNLCTEGVIIYSLEVHGSQDMLVAPRGPHLEAQERKALNMHHSDCSKVSECVRKLPARRMFKYAGDCYPFLFVGRLASEGVVSSLGVRPRS